MYYGHNPKFPDNFMWGASSAAWQVEGGVADGGRTPAIIDLNSKTKKPFADNTYAADHYHHYKEDVALMAECGFSSYRFSLSWSRIIPHADGKVNPEGIAFYNDLINELVAHNITPIVTLYHYDLPVWVDELGGWKSRDTVERFEHYCRAHDLPDQVKIWPSPPDRPGADLYFTGHLARLVDSSDTAGLLADMLREYGVTLTV